MALSEAERREFALDDLLATSLPHAGTNPVVEVDDAELKLLLALARAEGDAQAAQEPEVEPLPLLTTEVGLVVPTKARVQFGEARNHQRHPQAQPSQASHPDVEVRQLPLF